MRSSRSLLSGASALLMLASLATPGAVAQETKAQRRQPPPGSNIRSVEVSSDHKVTFRIYAPKADEVSVAGDFGNSKMEKDDKGVWFTTVGPLTPDYYTYTFRVDGVQTVDPRNPMIKPGLGSVSSMLQVPGSEAEFETQKEVPHGQIRVDWYRSATLGTERSLRVYTPPGYDQTAEPYPVFYLLHGAGDDDAGWSTVGRAGFILDNLLAEKKALPMIVVMPNGSLPRPANFPRFTPGTEPSPEARAAMEAMQNRFTDELLKDIVPFVEKHYRTLKGPENRAIAGLSMGGGQTLRVLLTHPGEFGYVGLWSAAAFRGNPEEFERRNEAFFKQADKVNKDVKLLSISVGDKDFLLEGSKGLDELLNKHNIKHAMHVSGGGHTWINWRHYLNEFAPKLFH